ncbi:MAG: hypothetical protein K2N13_09175 [Paraprevotella sp.]|nr:hypothetical protein [Paraprevotella sp.]
MKYRKLFYAILCMMAVNAGLTACVDDEEGECLTCGYQGNDCSDTPSDYENHVFILNQGSWGTIDASLCRYNSADRSVTHNLFSTKNGISLGDTGQDMIFYNDQVYITVSGGRTVYHVGRCGILKAAYHATAEVRSLAAKDGKIYVSCYGGTVLKLDAETMEKEAELQVVENANLEGMAICGNILYVAKSHTQGENNPIYHNTLEAIDLTDFRHIGTYQVAVNPNDVLEMDGKVYVLSWGDYALNGYGYDLGYLTPGETPSYTSVCPASKMAIYDHTVYYAYSETDWSTYTTTTSFGSYDAATGTLNETSFLKPSDATTLLSTSSIYMIEVDPHNGDFYIAASDYQNHSVVYRFDHEGNYLTSFNTGGINACQAIFM